MTAFDQNLYIILGNHLKRIRTKQNMTLEQLSEKVDKSIKTLSRYEKGEHRMDVGTIKDLSNALGYDCKILLSEVTEEFNNAKNNKQLYFTSAEDAMAFILKAPSVSAFGGYDIEKMTDEEIIEFANDILSMIQIVGSKYKK